MTAHGDSGLMLASAAQASVSLAGQAAGVTTGTSPKILLVEPVLIEGAAGAVTRPIDSRPPIRPCSGNSISQMVSLLFELQ